MDYIQKAIDKARSERQGNAGRPNEAQAGAEGAAAQTNNALSPADSGVLDSISYTKTRQLHIDDDVLRDNCIIANFQFDKRAEVFRQLRTQVLQKLRANNWKTLAITSPREGAGKSVTALNLAISISREVNQTVLLVDLDLRNPSILKLLEVEADQGLVDHIKGDASIQEILINPGFERLVILPAKPDPNYSSELLSSPQMKALVEDLRSRYESRIIIFDLPALLINDDALVFTPQVDAVMLVLEDRVTSPEDVKRSMQLLEGSNLLGTVLNKAGLVQ